MSIQEELDKIRNAIYGREVRESIAKGIETAYDDASEKDNANMEVKIARGTYPTLRDRLNDVDNTQQQTTAQLAQTERELDSKKLDRNRGAVTSADLSQEVKEQLTGGSVAVVGKNTVLEDNIVDGQVSEKKTTFIDISTNLFNVADVILGHSVDGSTGELLPNETYNASEMIEVEPDTTYSTYGFSKIVYHNTNGEVVGMKHLSSEGDTFTTPTTVKDVRLQYAITNQNTPRQINVGSDLLTYEPYYKRISENVSIDSESFENKSFTTEKFADDSVTEDIASFISLSSNLFNKETASPGAVSSSGSYDEENTQYMTSDFISVDPNTKYTFTHATYVAHYDINNHFIKRTAATTLEPNVLETDSNTAKLRLSINRYVGDITLTQINKGKELLSYEDYGYKLDDNISVNGLKKQGDLWQLNQYVIEGITEGFYHGEEMVGFDEPYAVTKEDVYGWYDDLDKNNTKTTLATDGVGNPIYGYEFNVPRVPTDGDGRLKEKTPKMVLVSGVHGQEKAGIYNLYNTMKAITQDWRTNELLETLRYNVDFIVVPVVNPDGFDRTERKNENGVDLARNFPERWEYAPSNPDTITYRGASPLSEAGSQAVSQLLEENKEDTILFMSHHNFGGGGHFVWNAAATKLQLDLAKKLVSKLTREWLKENEWLPQEEDWFVGYADDGSPSGSESMYATSLGIQSSTFEIGHEFPYETSPVQYNDTTFTFGVEVLVNWLVMNLRENTKFYNKLQ